MRLFSLFFFNDTATTEIYTLSLHDALPIYRAVADYYEAVVHAGADTKLAANWVINEVLGDAKTHQEQLRVPPGARSEEHTSELQSQSNLVCRLLLEKKKKTIH